ncbi:MAG TPA: prepilin-type N-terminal cleavage/methylation domain-containing protein [bacterium]|nr:prepilin-type N-terminal cleavage/methylation domain-containing protein [bacterium]HPT29858.1 prepilin-type N-terminal cleavage/methylation domain-containing protein [bacterium]
MNSQKGFSLIVLLLAVAIIALLFTWGITQGGWFNSPEQKAEIKADLNNLEIQNDLHNQTLINSLENN